MRKTLIAVTVTGALLGAWAPAASAGPEVCNYGRGASDAAKVDGSNRPYTEASGPLTINGNNFNTPPGHEEGICYTGF
jgi:hypothetical protein